MNLESFLHRSCFIFAHWVFFRLKSCKCFPSVCVQSSSPVLRYRCTTQIIHSAHSWKKEFSRKKSLEKRDLLQNFGGKVVYRAVKYEVLETILSSRDAENEAVTQTGKPVWKLPYIEVSCSWGELEGIWMNAAVQVLACRPSERVSGPSSKVPFSSGHIEQRSSQGRARQRFTTFKN